MGITQKVNELQQSMIGAINNAQLPACIVVLVMEPLLAEVKAQARAQLKAEEEQQMPDEEVKEEMG